MSSQHKSKWLLAIYLACFELLLTSFCGFIAVAAAGYRPGVAVRNILVSFRALEETRSVDGLSVTGFALVLWLVWTAFSAFTIITEMILLILVKRASRSVDRYRESDTVRRSLDPYDASAGRASGRGLASSIWQGASAACVLLAIASLSLYAVSLVGFFFNPVVYSVAFVFAFALGVGSGFGAISKGGTSGAGSGGWTQRFKAAPLWMRLAILATGTILVFVCVRTGYVTLTHPALYSTVVGSTNLAAVGSFLFFVDALAFRPTMSPCQAVPDAN